MLISAEKANYPITFMCALLGMSRSAYYAWAGRAQLSATAARRAQLTEFVVAVFDEYEHRYGCRRIAWVFNAERGVPVSAGTVADIMRENGLRAVQPRAYKRTTVPGEERVNVPDRIGRAFTAATPGTRLVGDVTYSAH